MLDFHLAKLPASPMFSIAEIDSKKTLKKTLSAQLCYNFTNDSGSRHQKKNNRETLEINEEKRKRKKGDQRDRTNRNLRH